MRPLGIASRIDAVTVFRRGARVTRVAELPAEADGSFPRAVRVSGLPLGLEDSSVRARVELADPGAAGDKRLPAAVDLRVVLDVPDPDPSQRPANDAELERARLEERLLEADDTHVVSQLAHLERLDLVARPRGKAGDSPLPSPTSARLSLVRFKGDRERALAAELRQVRDKLDRARRRRERLEDLAQRASSARQADEHELRKAVVVSLAGGCAGDGSAARCRLYVDYLVLGARWAPAYALRLDRGMTGAAMALRAIVAQNSGEDWSHVALTLSTAEAQVWVELPELPSIRIGRRQSPPVRVGWRSPPTGVDELYRDWDRVFGGRVPRPTPSPYPARGRPDETARLPPVQLSGANDGAANAARPAREGGEEFEEDTAVRTAPPPDPATVQAVIALGSAATTVRTRRTGATVPASAALARTATVRPADKAAAGAPPPPTAPTALVPGATGLVGLGAAAFGTAGFGPAGPELPPLPPRPVELEAGAEFLRYGDLRMPPPSSRRRGRLAPASRVELYMSLLIEERVEARFDVLGAVESARQRSMAVSLPPGCVLSWAEGYDYAYRAEARVDVPSDGDSHSVPLLERRASSEPLYVVVPRESTEVFRTACIGNSLDAPLLPGPVDVYVGGDFLLTSRLELTPAQSRFSVGLGVEQGIKVARNTRFREVSAGLMGGALVLHHQVHIELRSHLGHPARIEVRERIPVAREGDNDIHVAVQAVEPGWEVWEQEPIRPSEPHLRGGYCWRVTLGGGARQELRVDYDIRIPAKQELQGGNRREE